MRNLGEAPKELREQWIWIAVNSFAEGYTTGVASEEACWGRIIKYMVENGYEHELSEMLRDYNVYLTMRESCPGGCNMPPYKRKELDKLLKEMLVKLEEAMKEPEA